jgi:hypothetical protein
MAAADPNCGCDQPSDATRSFDRSETFNVFEANPESGHYRAALRPQHCAQKAAFTVLKWVLPVRRQLGSHSSGKVEVSYSGIWICLM